MPNFWQTVIHCIWKKSLMSGLIEEFLTILTLLLCYIPVFSIPWWQHSVHLEVLPFWFVLFIQFSIPLQLILNQSLKNCWILSYFLFLHNKYLCNCFSLLGIFAGNYVLKASASMTCHFAKKNITEARTI